MIRPPLRLVRGVLILCAAIALAAPATAAPGAHGPNGEHLDGPAQQGNGASAPKLEAKSELFELVATLTAPELSIVVDKFETNEPVLGAQVEVEAGKLKAVAKFQADRGDYAVTDPAFLQALSQPGEHALVFTVVAGQDSDLLEGTLRRGATQSHDHGSGLNAGRLAAFAAAALLLGGSAVAVVRRRRSEWEKRSAL